MSRINSPFIVHIRKKFSFLALIAIFALILIGCGSGATSGKFRQSDFNGTWVGKFNIVMTISSSEITIVQSNVVNDEPWSHINDPEITFIQTINNVTPMINTNDRTSANYPSGFRFDGTITRNDDKAPGAPKAGGDYRRTIFMHTNKKEIISGDNTFQKQ